MNDKLSKNKLSSILQFILKTQSSYYKHYFNEINKSLSSIYLKYDINPESLLCTHLVNDRLTTNSEIIIDTFIDNLSTSLDNKITVWSDDFWAILTCIYYSTTISYSSQQQKVSYIDSYSNKQNKYFYEVVSLFNKDDFLLNFEKYLSSSLRIDKRHIDIFYNLNKKTKKEVPSFLINYPEYDEKEIFNKLKYISKYNNDNAKKILLNLFEKINGSVYSEKATKLLSKSGIDLEPPKALLYESCSLIYHKEIIQINPVYFMQKYNLSGSNSLIYIENFFKIIENNNNLFEISFKKGFTNETFKNSNTYVITLSDTDSEKVKSLKNKIISYIDFAGDVLLNQSSEFYLLHYNFSKNNKQFFIDCFDVLSKFNLQKELEANTLNTKLKTIKNKI